jgi:hypothetical protein
VRLRAERGLQSGRPEGLNVKVLGRLLFLPLVMAASLFAQEPAPAGPQAPTFRSGTNLVALNVTVLD